MSIAYKDACVEDIQKANKSIKKMKQNQVAIKFSKLQNTSGCRIVTFCDASFKNLPDEGSQGGFIIFLCDKDGTFSPIHWQSKKIKGIFKSTLVVECLALQESAETAFYIKTILCEILNINQQDITIECYTDNKSLVDSVHSSKTLQDKKLIIDMAIVKEMLQKKEISCINWI